MKKLLLLFGLCECLTAAHVASTTLSVTIRPAAAIRQSGPDHIEVLVRLAPQTQALLWRADVCALPVQRSYVIGQSGSFVVAADALPGEGRQICLQSSDVTIRKALAR